jgi:hypothetical protein
VSLLGRLPLFRAGTDSLAPPFAGLSFIFMQHQPLFILIISPPHGQRVSNPFIFSFAFPFVSSWLGGSPFQPSSVLQSSLDFLLNHSILAAWGLAAAFCSPYL